MDLFDTEPRDGFRRNLLVVIGVHVALLGGLWLANRSARPPEEQITWLDGGALAGAPQEPEAVAPIVEPPPPAEVLPAEPEEKAQSEPEVIPPPPKPEPEPEPIVPPKPAPTPVPTPKPAATPTPKPKPKPKVVVKATPKPRPKKSSTPAPKKTVAKAAQPRKPATAAPRSTTSTAKPSGSPSTNHGSGRAGAPNGAASAAELRSYYTAVGEEFRGTWNVYKPLVGEGSGSQLSARVHVRISASGSVLQATLTRSTGNQEVDASIRRSFGDFKKVPAPPAALLKGGVFESDMAVILSI